MDNRLRIDPPSRLDRRGRPALLEEAERQLSYWERHGNNPEAVAKWAVQDLLGILRYIVEAEA
jgi:hypothetical protein